jgi:hypothetical protein
MTDDLVARLRLEGDDEAVEALRFQEASIRRLERKLAAAEAKEHESFQQYVDANEARIDAESRATSAEQERDEAIAALKPMADVAVDIPESWDDDRQCIIACGHFRRAGQVIRRLAAGTEKEEPNG